MLVNRRKNISTNTRNVIGLKSPLKKNEIPILKKNDPFPLSILTGKMEYDISEPESPYLRKNKKNRKFIDLKSLFNFFPRFFSEIKALIHSEKYKRALKMCEFYFNQERKFNCFNEIKMNRINCRILQKIIEKRIENNSENKENIEENLLKYYIKSFSFWFKFLTSDINNLKNWNTDVLKQEFNDYPTLFTENEELISFDLKQLKLPDFVQFSLKNKKSELEIEKQISYEMGEFVLNFLNLYFIYALKYKKDKNYRMSYLFAKNSYKISKLCLRSINPDIIHMCIKIRIFLGNFNLEFGRYFLKIIKNKKKGKRLQKSEYLFETSLVLLEHELSIRESLNNLSNNYKNHGYHFKKIVFFFKNYNLIFR